MIQTLVPDHKVIRLAADQDYDGFYNLEIGLRKLQKCPPFGDIATVTFTGLDEALVIRSAVKFQESLRECLKTPGYENESCAVLGPAPCPVPKINYNFRYRLTLQCTMSQVLRGLLAHLMRAFAKDKQTRGVSVFIDVNGID